MFLLIIKVERDLVDHTGIDAGAWDLDLNDIDWPWDLDLLVDESIEVGRNTNGIQRNSSIDGKGDESMDIEVGRDA
jgi:hypothetical protein